MGCDKPEPNYRQVVFPAIPAGNVPDDWDAVPVNLKDDDAQTALTSPDGISKQWLTGAPRRAIEHLNTAILQTVAEEAHYATNQQTGEISISPSPTERPEGWMIKLTGLLFMQQGGDWVEVALSRNVVQKSEEAFPAKLIATTAESANARIQTEIHTGGDRDDQLLRFPAFRDPSGSTINAVPKPNKNNWHHTRRDSASRLETCHLLLGHPQQPELRWRLVFAPTGDLVREFAPVQIAIRLVSESEAQGTTIALTRDQHGVYVSAQLAAKYRPNKIDGANPPPQADVSLLANPQNGLFGWR